jgi:hypothetical protein
MGPHLLHLCILVALMAPGVSLFAAEAFFWETGGMLFTQYAATKLYWLVFLGYTTVSTTIVASVNIVLRLVKRAFTKKAVVLCHVLPVALLWLLVEFNIHDTIQDMWETRAKRRQITETQPVHDTLRKRPHISPSPVLKPSLYRAPTGNPVEPQKQTADRSPPEEVKE